MSIKGKPASGPPPLLKNAASAPFIYFDNAPVFGTFSGNIEIELAARMLMPKPDQTVAVEMACTAHLRCSPQAAAALLDGISKALAMFAKHTPQAQPINGEEISLHS